ncbi:MAG: MmgE/PrpD family protein [Desulfurococcales archaeon]|nr:MmgE/PrpD family protein [Desulfurococcales archaeon]
MSRISRTIAEWVHSFKLDDAPESVIEEAKKRIVDSAGVAIGAFNEEPVKIARWVAESTTGSRLPATIWGSNIRAAADHAAFANGCAVRYFDFNDTYLSKEALHPSDMIPALVAAAEVSDATGREVLEGLITSYEVVGALADSYSVRGRGWDHVVYINIATAAGAAKILGLDVDGIEQAVNIATNTSLALRQTRAGELSMWKGCAAAHAARNGLFSALLAWRGMTGPSPVFEGEFGFFNVALCGDRFKLSPLGEYRLLKTSIKYWPVEYHSMSAVEAALKIREEAGALTPEDIEEVIVKTFTVSYKIIVKDPEKWDPKTRETADHSLPYIVAAALLDGYVWIDTFKPERFLADDVRKVMKRMKVEVDPEYDKIYPDGIGNRIIVRVKGGRVYEYESIYPPGHFKNPLTREGVEEKFYKITKGLLPRDRARRFLELAWRFEEIEDPGRLFRILKV